MMRFLSGLIVLAVVSSPSVAVAQDVAYGVKGGLNLATVSFDPELPLDYGLRLGIVAGAFVSLPLGSRLAVQPEALFSQKGAAVDDNGVDATLRLDYVEIPVLLKYSLSAARTPGGTSVFVFGGPAVAFKIRAEASATFGEETIDDDIDEDIEDMDLGIAFGAGVAFGRVMIDGRYTLGLSNISTDEEEGGKARNRTLSVLAGFRF
jgi:hypothetical protein